MKEFACTECVKTPFSKRALDVAGSAAALTLCAPLLGLAVCWIKIVSPGPALRAVRRVGYKGGVFGRLKLRTRRMGAGESRDIPGGEWIRLLGIDEIPRLWNVLRGDMSLVGPLAVDERTVRLHYGDRHWRALDAPPGLTGPRQIRGLRGRANMAPQGPDSIELDLDYVRRQSSFLDMRLLAHTAWAIGVKSWRVAAETRSRRSASTVTAS